MMVIVATFRRACALVSVAAALLGALVGPARPVAAQVAERCFTETGFCISGAIRQYWERNGGLATFGYPVSEQRRETVEQVWTGPVQWFERDRLEDHAADGQGVLAGRLGARSLELQGINWQALPGDDAVTPGCRFFRETQFNLCGTFLRYWERNGGLERFGFPLTRERQETLDGRTYTVQYFERRRMELHPENAGTPYEVLLGLLGRDVFGAEGGKHVTPIPVGDVDGAVQQAILDAAYAHMRAANPRTKLAVALGDVVGDYAVAQALPYGGSRTFVYLERSGGVWRVVDSGLGADVGERARAHGFPAQLIGNDGVGGAYLVQLQGLQSGGVNAYATRARIAGDYARLWVVPGTSEGLDAVSVFFKRQGGAWAFLTAGSAFPEGSLQQLGVPRELWPYGEVVRGPQ
jgi:hypothetical protein